MIDDQIKIAIQNLIKIRNQHRDLKKDLSTEKNKALKAVEELQKLLEARKDLTAQVKDIQDKIEKEWGGEDFIRELREDVILKEEEMETEKGKLFELIEKLNKNTPVEMKVECDDGTLVNFQMIPAPRVYINGKEEKAD